MKLTFKNPFGIRSKLVFLSSFLLFLPWLGYQYILEMEEYLRRGQEQTVDPHQSRHEGRQLDPPQQ